MQFTFPYCLCSSLHIHTHTWGFGQEPAIGKPGGDTVIDMPSPQVSLTVCENKCYLSSHIQYRLYACMIEYYTIIYRTFRTVGGGGETSTGSTKASDSMEYTDMNVSDLIRYDYITVSDCKRLALIELLISWFVVKPHDYCYKNFVNCILGGG